MTPTRKPPTAEVMAAAKVALREVLDGEREVHIVRSRPRMWRYVLRRRDWLVWLLRKDASLPRRWWSL